MFKDCKVLITGADTAIGKAAVKMFLDEGAVVLAAGGALNLQMQTDDLYLFEGALDTEGGLDELIAYAAGVFSSSLDIVIHATDIDARESIIATGADALHRMHDKVLLPALYMNDRIAPMLKNNGRGNPSILHIASSRNRNMRPEDGLSGLSHLALLQLTRSQACELAPVRVNSISTAVGVPEDVERLLPVIRYLSSQKAAFMTGTDILCDKGEHLKAFFAEDEVAGEQNRQDTEEGYEEYPAGCVALVTGAGSGIGHACVQKLLDQGATVIGVDKRFQEEEISEETYIRVKADVTDKESVDALYDLINTRFGRLDALITGAGKAGFDNPETITRKTLDRAYELHVKHHVMYVKAFLPLLRKSSNASITIISSTAGMIFTPGELSELSYGTMKGAILHYLKGCAKALSGIRCNAVAPGFIRTGLVASSFFEVIENSREFTIVPISRFGTAEEVADLITFLTDEDACMINGAILTIDGGISVTWPGFNML